MHIKGKIKNGGKNKYISDISVAEENLIWVNVSDPA